MKPHLLDSIARLRKMIEIDAPGVIIGAEVWNVLTTVMAAYGLSAGSTMLEALAEWNLHRRGICTNGGCTAAIDRPAVPLCEKCAVELGLEDCEIVIPEPDSSNGANLNEPQG